MDPTHEFHRPDKPHLPGYDGWRGAGVVLTWLALCSHCSTCPFAIVLCIEWLRDPRRTDEHRRSDGTALRFASVGAVYWLLASIGMLVPHGGAFIVVIYWCGFAVWLIVRAVTRWREIGELRRLDALVPPVPTPDPTPVEARVVDPVAVEVTATPVGPPPVLDVERGLREALERGLIALTVAILLLLYGSGVFFAPFVGVADSSLMHAGDATLLLGWLVLLVACAGWATFAPDGPYRFLRTWCVLASAGLPVTLFLATLRGPRTQWKGESPRPPDLFLVLAFVVPVLAATLVLTVIRRQAAVRSREASSEPTKSGC